MYYIIHVGSKGPAWTEAAFDEFAKRLGKLVKSETLPKGKGQTAKQNKEAEAKSILKAIPDRAIIIALDVLGDAWSTDDLTQKMKTWQQTGQPVAFIIGGPDGLDESILNKAHQKLSLSKLTFPHTLARVMLIEQIYRADSILKNHPYHRN